MKTKLTNRENTQIIKIYDRTMYAIKFSRKLEAKKESVKLDGEVTGVYILINNATSGFEVYVGQSVRGVKRAFAHKEGEEYDNRVWDEGIFFANSDFTSDDIDFLERKLTEAIDTNYAKVSTKVTNKVRNLSDDEISLNETRLEEIVEVFNTYFNMFNLNKIFNLNKEEYVEEEVEVKEKDIDRNVPTDLQAWGIPVGAELKWKSCNEEINAQVDSPIVVTACDKVSYDGKEYTITALRDYLVGRSEWINGKLTKLHDEKLSLIKGKRATKILFYNNKAICAYKDEYLKK